MNNVKYSKTFSLWATIAWIFIALLAIISIFIIPFIEQIDTNLEVCGYILMIILVVFIVIYSLYSIIRFTSIKITIDSNGVSKKGIFSSCFLRWDDITSIKRQQINEHFMGSGIGYIFISKTVIIETFENSKLIHFLDEYLEEWNNNLYDEYRTQKQQTH